MLREVGGWIGEGIGRRSGEPGFTGSLFLAWGAGLIEDLLAWLP
ncbi:hypothetical protein [Ureibacillus terrenus]|nr:hypothetical protein [Ureibacillus terrenus]MED3662072.1 hypothetical protein [Ureibacillus terrenus]MED3765191.1 hypothetical protein [Ureibacillus terrenus]